jgi:lipopolysaccharide transport system permease protein
MAARVVTIDSRAGLDWRSLGDLWAYRELLWSLSVRETKARYRQSLLGIGWAIAQPLAMMVVFNLVFSRFAGVPSDGIPYPIFAYAALVPWTFLSNAMTSATIGLVSNRTIVTKTYFPREIIVISQVGARFVDFLAGALVYVGMMAWYGIAPTVWLLLLPLLLLIQVVLTVGLCLITSALHVRFRDLAPIVTLGLQVWLYLTPVTYPLSLVPEQWRTLYLLNPMAGLILAYRSVIALGQGPDFGALGLAAGMSLLVLAVAYPWFKRAERSFADVI